MVPAKCEYTNQILARMGYFWHATDSDYIRKFINVLTGLGFFDEDDLPR